MTNESQQTHATDAKPIPFGTRLKSARETLGLERKDVAAQLRLNEKIIIMMEKDRYPADLPVTFIRGYLRAYGKLLQIPDHEVKKAIEPIKQKPMLHSSSPAILTPAPTTSHYFMQVFTYLIVLTMVGLVGMWWYSHSTGSAPMMAESQLPITVEDSSATMPTVPETLPAPSATTPVAENNPVDRAEKIKNDTNQATTKVAQSKNITKKRVIPEEEETTSSENDSYEEESEHVETNGENQAD